MQTYRKQGRIHKKLTRDRKKCLSRRCIPCSNLSMKEGNQPLIVRSGEAHPVFVVQKEEPAGLSSSERSPSSSEEGEATCFEIAQGRPVFVFRCYSETIVASYSRRCAHKMKFIQCLNQRTLPNPLN